MPYKVRLAPQVARVLRKERDRDLLRRLVSAIGGLGTSPRPSGFQKLEGDEGLWRIRVGDHRMIYTIDDGALVVLVITVGNRREVSADATEGSRRSTPAEFPPLGDTAS